MARVLVTGASGVLGRELLPRLRTQGLDAVPAGRSEGVDLATGEGLTAALRGVDMVVHAATDPRAAQAVDVGGTHRLVAAAAEAGVHHLVHVSIVGVDRVPLAYYRAKLAAEQAVRDSGLGWSILRSTQWYGLVDTLRRRVLAGPVQLAPLGVRIAPVDPADVASLLVHRVMAAPTRRVDEMAGPEDLDAVRMFRRAAGRATVPVPVPGRLAAALRDGALLPGPGAARGALTWSAWLDRHAS